MDQGGSWILGAGLGTVILTLLALDLGLFHREAHEVKTREALGWAGIWIGLSLVFCLVLYFWWSPAKALEFLTGYLIEESLSVDNLFVFTLIFTHFKIQPRYQHKVLFWGILSALIMRGVMILAGIGLIQHFHWIFYVFGGFLILTAIQMLLDKGEEKNLEKNPMIRFATKLFPVAAQYEGDHFFTRHNGKIFATPLLLALVAVEGADLIFAIDSIPAVLAVTTDPFIVYTSNLCAILGLRSLYFALARAMNLFRHLNTGVAVILILTGFKMLLTNIYPIPNGISLIIIISVLAASILASRK